MYVSSYGNPDRFGPTTQAMYQHMADLGWNPDDCNQRYDALVKARQDSSGSANFKPGEIPVDLMWFMHSVSLWYSRGTVTPPPSDKAAPPVPTVVTESIPGGGTWKRPDWYDGPAPSRGGTVASA